MFVCAFGCGCELFFIFPQERARTSIDNISNSQAKTSTNKSYEGIDNDTLALSKKFCLAVGMVNIFALKLRDATK